MLGSPKAGTKHHGSVPQCSNICEAANLCKTNTQLILWWAETVKNRCCTPHIAVISRNKQVFWCFALLVMFTHLILLRSIIKATHEPQISEWLIKSYSFSDLSNFNVKSCLLYLQEQPQPLKGITCRNISKQSKLNVFKVPAWCELGNGLQVPKQRRCWRDVSKAFYYKADLHWPGDLVGSTQGKAGLTAWWRSPCCCRLQSGSCTAGSRGHGSGERRRRKSKWRQPRNSLCCFSCFPFITIPFLFD